MLNFKIFTSVTFTFTSFLFNKFFITINNKVIIDWWVVRVTLVVAWWLFAPKFWNIVGSHESLFCSKMNAASVVVTCELVGTLNHYKLVAKNSTLCTKRYWGCRNFSIISSSLVIELVLELELELAKTILFFCYIDLVGKHV